MNSAIQALMGGPPPTPEKMREDQERVFEGDIKSLSEKLKDLQKRYSEPVDFKPGDIVRWKEGLKNRNGFEYGEPLIVMGYAFDKVNEDHNPYHPMFNEPLDLKVGHLLSDGLFAIFYVDSSRMELHDGSLTKSEQYTLAEKAAVANQIIPPKTVIKPTLVN